MIKAYLIIVLVSFSSILFAQDIINCDSVSYEGHYTGYCIEYLDLRWNPVSPAEAQFKRFIYFTNGERAITLATGYSNYHIQRNHKNLLAGGTIDFLNGLYQIIDDDGKIVKELRYIKGHLK